MCGPCVAPRTLTPYLGIESILECMMVQDGCGDSVFRSNVPCVRLAEYARWCDERMKCGPQCWAWAVVLIGRSKLPVTHSTVHRMLLAALLLAVKYSDDVYYTNKVYATIGCVGLAELNKMEVAMLGALDWQAHIDNNTFAHMQAAIDERQAMLMPPLTTATYMHTLEVSKPQGEPIGLILKGTRIAGVIPRSTSHTSGLCRGMMILSINGHPVQTDHEITSMIKKCSDMYVTVATSV
eukprot:TRINITY_DN25293_c0_g1_i1.p1 TRINITY_DN25293_c0_g1~~TRINITY_DN25293_c0_g1_i1.p1  ORF type:complete len:252 (+),score=60.68 TRINITY_DN25293_c0_g1_i1:45-758(+)